MQVLGPTNLPIKHIGEPLYVITCISNPVRFRSRYNLYRQFEKYIKNSGAVLITIEQQFGQRHFEVTDPDNPHHIQVQSTDELWFKENLINLALARLPHDWKYVAWIDADVIFARADWVSETIHLLQHYKVIQMWSKATDLGPNYEPLKTHNGFVAGWINSGCEPIKADKYQQLHPGYAWAATRDALNKLGGLIDWAILGSADRHQACALIGQVENSFQAKGIEETCPVYVEWCKNWQARAEKHIERNVGYMEGLLLHYFHGSKKNRNYYNRWKILMSNHFDPSTDIYRDVYGQWQLTGNKLKLRDQLRAYFRSRKEDSIDVD